MGEMDAGMKIAELTSPFLIGLLALVITLWIKDFATKLAKGLMFKMNRAFNEGDKVILDGSDAIIVKIGITQTVFGVYSERGYTWRYLPNERIDYVKLEKVINKDLHLDTDLERAQKLQSLIDTVQDSGIEQNKKDIEKIKNGN